MAKVLSSISGNLISAASAGYAPTNSGDVSAIASAYQVVSATGTQLYAGTAHVTSINSAPISASRAGNAANASMATSAWYDGTGRLISALPDSAAVSSIASSYAPTFGLNGGKISSINGSALDAPTGGGVVTATGSAWIGGNIGVSSINGSSIYAVSAGKAYSDEYGTPIAPYYAKQSSLTGVSSTVANNSASWGAGPTISSPSGTIVVNGDDIEGTNSAVLTATATGFSSTAYLYNQYIPDTAIVSLVTGILPGTGGVLRLSADNPIYSADIYLIGADSAGPGIVMTATVSGDTRDMVIPLGPIDRYVSASASQYITMWQNAVYTAEKTGGVQVTGVAELAWKSAVDDVTNTVSSNSATWGGGGGVDSATVSAIASSYAESAVSSKADSSALSSYALSADVSAYRVVSSIGKAPDDMAMDGEVVTTINGTELRALNATMDLSGRYLTNLPDSAAVSAIASSYAESAVSSKADSSALSSYALSADASGCIDTVSSNSATWAAVTSKLDSSASSSFYTTANESGYIGSAYVESSISAYQPLSGMSAYESSFSAGVGLEFVQSGDDRILQVDTPVDIVAGPGIVIDNPDGNTLRVSQQYPTDETVLWEGSLALNNDTGTLSEAIENFQSVAIYAQSVYGGGFRKFVYMLNGQAPQYRFSTDSLDGASIYQVFFNLNITGTQVTISRSKKVTIQYSTNSVTCADQTSPSSIISYVTKVVGIHRIANN